jgi:hypothetical protein
LRHNVSAGEEIFIHLILLQQFYYSQAEAEIFRFEKLRILFLYDRIEMEDTSSQFDI